jgi:hypothetical protein
MKQNIIVGTILFIILLLGIFGLTKLIQPPKPTSGTLSQNSKLGNIHEVETDQGKVIVGNPKSSNTNKIEPQIELSKWNEEVKMKVNYDIDAKEVVTQDNAIIWKGDKQDLIYKQIPAKKETTLKKIPKPRIKLAQNNNNIRYIKFGLTNLKTLAASYELFEKTNATQPTITSFIPNEEGYLFFGDRKAEIDLRNIDTIPYPIVRVKTENTFSCPVALSNNNGLFLVMYYAPDIEKRGEEVKNEFTAAINNVLKRHNVQTEIQRRDDFFYYMKDLQIKPVGRIAYDKNILIFNLYTQSPYTTGLKDYMRATFQKVRDEYLLPIGGLSELDSSITPEIVDEVINEFAKSTNKSVTPDTLNSLENSTLNALINIANNSDWKLKSERSDIPKKIADEERFDRFEFDILLYEIPESNIFTYQIETDGLDFFYQPDLTEEEKNDGAYRPENIIGSYAVYKKDAKIIHENTVDAEKYKAGKVMHIYRPKIIDAKNNSIWGTLNVNINSKTLTVTVDKQWLKSASYPVVVDPTFGYTTAGVSSNECKDKMIGSNFLGAAGTGVSISAYFANINSESRNYRFGLYRDSDSVYLAETSEGIATAVGWKTQPFTAAPSLSAISYVLVGICQLQSKNNLAAIAFDTGAANQTYRQDFNYGTAWPNPATFIHADNFGRSTDKFSIYVTYTGVVKSNLKGNINLKGSIKLQ